MDNIYIAMSGGVDSGTSAYLIKQQYPNAHVVGITMNLGDFCTGAISKAKRICDWLGVEHRVLDLREQFQTEIINHFHNQIINTITPIPCASCNRQFKFGHVLEYCRKNGAKLATGHYANKVEINGQPRITRARDVLKDQTHFIYNIRASALSDILFPLGDYLKAEVFRLATKIGLPYLNSSNQYSESQDVCFFGGKTYAEYIKALHLTDEGKAGDILHISTGKRLGEHKGLWKYTIGQRQGLGVAWTEPLYVVKKDVINNILFVGEEQTLYTNSLQIAEVNFLVDKTALLDNKNSFDCQVCLRDKTPLIDAKVQVDGTRAEVQLCQPARAITPGQACVFYRGEVLLGGGEIK
jgi:tRNA-specific 2-thiouridylase